MIGPWGPLYLASIWGKRTRIVLRRFLNVPCMELATYHLGSHFFSAKTLPHDYTARNTGIILNCVLGKKGSVRFLEIWVYGKIGE